MKPSEYIEQSGRTAAAAKVHLEFFQNHAKMLHQLMDIVQSGHTGDAMKRSLFYSDPKIAERLSAAHEAMVKSYQFLEKNEGSVELKEPEINLLHAILGMASETGEIADEMINSVIENRPVDRDNLIEEAGDTLWYIAMLLRYLEVDFETVWQKNIDKLKARYPQRFTTEDALNRDLDEEKKALAG